MLNNMQINDEKQELKRKILFIIIGIVCGISIILAVVFQVQKEATPKVEQPIIEEKPIMDFKSIFDNKLNEQGYNTTQLEKIKDEEKIIYTKYDGSEKIDGKYDIDLKIPTINIDNSQIEDINKEINDLFREKAIDILCGDQEEEIIYTVEYTSYINSNILSLVIKSNLKEGRNAQRVIVKSYTYNMTTGELLDINEMISIKQLDRTVLQKEISNTIAENAKQANSLIDLGYKVYERNLSDSMYKIENVDNFFYGPDGVLYIIYAYGNNSYTSEMDVIPIR